MQAYYFTEDVRHVLAVARNEAAALGHEYVGCEHMLLGLFADNGAGSAVLRNLGVDLAQTAQTLARAETLRLLGNDNV